MRFNGWDTLVNHVFRVLNVFNLLLGPLVLTSDLIFFLRSEVVLDVERLADLLGGFALDHIGNSLAANVKESLDIEVIRSLEKDGPLVNIRQQDRRVITYQDDLEEHLLVDLHEFLVPLINIRGLFARIRVILVSGSWVSLVMSAPLDDLL